MNKKEKLNPKIISILDPKKIAIIVVDMMDAYCDTNAPLSKYLIKNEGVSFEYLDIVANRIVDFIEHSRHFNISATVFVRMLERPELVSTSIALKMQIDKIPPVAEENGVGWNYYKLKPLKCDKEIIKYSHDSFINTDLNQYLKSKSIKTVIIIGGHASVCVDSTARTASQLGYHTFVPADLTADPTPNGEQQNPEIIRRRLYAINNVMGYMPLSSLILEVWKEKYSN